MFRVHEFFCRHAVQTTNVDPKKFSLLLALAMDKLTEYMALCCYFKVPCIQKVNFQGYDRDDTVPSNIVFVESDFTLSNYNNLVSDGLTKLDSYVERMVFNMKAISPKLNSVSILDLFSEDDAVVHNFSKTIFYADLVLERKRSILVDEGRAEYDGGGEAVLRSSNDGDDTQHELKHNYELERQLHADDKACCILDYNERDLEEAADDWEVKDEERPNSSNVLTEAEFILASALYRMGLWIPSHIY